MIESDTYIGGHVECLQQGVYRSDIPVKFKLKANAYEDLILQVGEIMNFALEVENDGIRPEDVENYDEVKAQITQQLEAIRE